MIINPRTVKKLALFFLFFFCSILLLLLLGEEWNLASVHPGAGLACSLGMLASLTTLWVWG